MVKYKLTWNGNVPQGVPADYSTKVYKNIEGTDFGTYLSLGGLMKSINNSSTGVSTYRIDFSMLPDEGIYEGMSGKWYFKDKRDLAKMAEKTTYEYTGKTKEIAGVNCQEVKVVFKDEDGDHDKTEIIYVTKELGPKTNMTYYPGLEAFPMEFPIELTKELSVVISVSELQKGKVKAEDLLLESGYEEIAKEDFEEWIGRLQKAQGGGADDDM